MSSGPDLHQQMFISSNDHLRSKYQCIASWLKKIERDNKDKKISFAQASFHKATKIRSQKQIKNRRRSYHSCNKQACVSSQVPQMHSSVCPLLMRSHLRHLEIHDLENGYAVNDFEIATDYMKAIFIHEESCVTSTNEMDHVHHART